MRNLIRQNLRPIALVILCAVIGALFGHAFIGFLIGIIIVSAATLFL